MNQRRRKFYTVSGTIILVLLVVLLWIRQLNSDLYTYGGSPSPTPTAMASHTATPKKTASPAAVSAMPQSYDNALQQYSSHRVQFDMSCQANPQRLSVANGTSIMLDNRSGDARIVTVGGVQYSLSGYGWKIVTVSSKTLPATIGLDCGAGRNVGTIVVQ